MKLVIDFSDKETLALRKYAAAQIASADERSLIAAIRVIVIDHLAISQYLNREEILDDIVVTALENLNKPGVNAPQQLPPKFETKLELPAKMRMDRETNTWKVLRFFIQQCLDNGSINWQLFKIVDIMDELGVEHKDVDAGIRALRKGNWLTQLGKTQYGFTEEAKGYLLANKQQLKELALLK